MTRTLATIGYILLLLAVGVLVGLGLHECGAPDWMIAAIIGAGCGPAVNAGPARKVSQ